MNLAEWWGRFASEQHRAEIWKQFHKTGKGVWLDGSRHRLTGLLVKSEILFLKRVLRRPTLCRAKGTFSHIHLVVRVGARGGVFVCMTL